MPSQKMKDAATQVKAALDKIAQAKSDPQAVQQAVNDAKAKIDQMVQQSEQD